MTIIRIVHLPLFLEISESEINPSDLCKNILITKQYKLSSNQSLEITRIQTEAVL